MAERHHGMGVSVKAIIFFIAFTSYFGSPFVHTETRDYGNTASATLSLEFWMGHNRTGFEGSHHTHLFMGERAQTLEFYVF
jgi:hypothetical protein